MAERGSGGGSPTPAPLRVGPGHEVRSRHLVGSFLIPSRAHHLLHHGRTPVHADGSVLRRCVPGGMVGRWIVRLSRIHVCIPDDIVLLGRLELEFQPR